MNYNLDNSSLNTFHLQGLSLHAGFLSLFLAVDLHKDELYMLDYTVCYCSIVYLCLCFIN